MTLGGRRRAEAPPLGRVPAPPCDARPDGGEARRPFVRPERASEWRAVAGTGRVHTASERGQWRLDRATSQKSRSFAIQPLSPWLSCKLPTLISGGWRGTGPAAEAGPAARPGALGGSPPPSGRSRGDAASGTLTCLAGPQVFVSVTKGEGCSLTPARGGGGGQGDLRIRAGFWRDSAAAPATGPPVSCPSVPLPLHPGALGGAGRSRGGGGQTCGFA